VLAFDQGGNQWGSATTDAGGHYTLKGLTTSADYRVEFYPAQNSPLAAQFYPSGVTLQAATPVQVTLGQTTANIDETLGQGGSISGAVTDAATGYPLGGTSIVLTDDAGHQVYSALSPITQPDGSYVINHLAPGSYKVEFSSVGALAFQYYNDANTLGSASSVTVSAGQTATNINGALVQGGTLAGVVTDASTGQGIAYGYLEVLDTKGNLVTYGYTEPNGHYQIHGIAPGSYYLQVAAYNNGLSQVEYYGGSRTLAGAKLVTIAPGATTAGIDVSVAPGSPASPSVAGQSTGTPATTPQTPVAVVTRVIPGPPTLSGGSVSGLGKGKPVVKFRLRSGSNGAHRLRSFKVKLPAGLAFVGAQLRKGVKVAGGGKVTEKLIAGQLVVTLGSPASAVTVSISSPALKVTRTLAAHSLRVLVTVSPVNGTGHLLSFTVKNPS
jgi:carboxypeptidase family protein